MELTRGRVDANGVSFHYLEAGRGPLVLCLHGFPDNAHTYNELLQALDSNGGRSRLTEPVGESATSEPDDAIARFFVLPRRFR